MSGVTTLMIVGAVMLAVLALFPVAAEPQSMYGKKSAAAAALRISLLA